MSGPVSRDSCSFIANVYILRLKIPTENSKTFVKDLCLYFLCSPFQASHVFCNYPAGIRYIGFYHKGKDTQFWAGHYGAKMTRSNVTLNFKHISGPVPRKCDCMGAYT